MSTSLKFVWNGIRVNGQICRARYSFYPQCVIRGQDGSVAKEVPLHIKIWGRDLDLFPVEVRQALTVENDSDPMSDYYEDDHITVLPSHPMWKKVGEGLIAQVEHRIRMSQKKGWDVTQGSHELEQIKRAVFNR